MAVYAGMAELYESERERATVLAWGNQTPSKLAWGTASGTVRMALVNSPAGVIHVGAHLCQLECSKMPDLCVTAWHSTACFMQQPSA